MSAEKQMEARNIYFLGIGGIGMSALARYFLRQGRRVGGYDLTETPLTRSLESEGARIHYTDDVEAIGADFRDPHTTLVVYTPAVPSSHSELEWFRANGFTVEKRSEMLGHVSEGKFVMAAAGTHGKTTVTTLTAWLNHVCTGGGSAFLGGISKNFDSNLVTGSGDRLAVEADEFDRSFLRLDPDAAVITSVSPDHLDIYGTPEAVRKAFAQFAARIKTGGVLILEKRAAVEVRNPGITVYSYSLDDPAADFRAENLRPAAGGQYEYDIVTPGGTVEGCRLGIPGMVNVENSVAAAALMWAAAKIRGEKLDHDKLRLGLRGFRGVKRRFDIHVDTPQGVYIDDYAHHPEELEAALVSLRGMFPGRKITALFQPHLYTRTRDLYRQFAAALSLADEVVLAPIYPAREKPVEGVRSEMIGELLTVPWRIAERQKLAQIVAEMDTDVVATFGAGNIENHCAEIAAAVKNKTR